MPSAESITIRAAQPADADVLDSLIRDLAAHEGAGAHVRFSPQQIAAALGGPAPRLHALLAHDAEGPLGFVTYTVDFAIWNGGDVLRVDDLFVVDRARRRGVGRLLMQRIALLALNGNMTARWEVEPVNRNAQAFYRSMGVEIRDKIVARWDLSAMRAALAVQPD